MMLPLRSTGCGRKRVRFLTNIPTPYRNHQFHQIAVAAEARGAVDFEVWFTGPTDNPVFKMPPDEVSYPYRFLASPYVPGPQRLASVAHLFKLLVQDKPHLIIVGGHFNAALQAACLLVRLPVGFRAMLFCENHRAFRSSPLRDYVRRFLVRGFKGFVVPGRLQEAYVRNMLDGGACVRFHRMPNVVVERVFGRAVSGARLARAEVRQQLGLDDSCRLFLSVMRLESVKGSDLLVEAVEDLGEHCRVLIVGEGSLRSRLECHPQVRSGKVILLGHCNEAEVARVLAASDLFVLPSRNDPYPLAVIEALWAGLPLILSSSVGCHPEALEPGQNGYLCESGSKRSLADALLRASRVDEATLRQMGETSRTLANQRFGSQGIAEEFVGFLEAS
jgi:glycosyltransferase involved in cell wall biosynthesis